MKRKLGKTDLWVNPIGFGGIPIQRLSETEADAVLNTALDAGINFFDSSRIYTDSESKMGRILSKKRNAVIIASKSFFRTAAEFALDIDKSLSFFKTDYLDLYQCHNISSDRDLETVLGPNGALEALHAAQKSGKIRYIGITGHKPWIVEKALSLFDFSTIQIPFNFIETSCLENLIPLAQKKQTGIIAMKPIAGGALTHIDLNLRFILTSGADVAIPGMDKSEQIQQNLSVLKSLQPLTNLEITLLEKERSQLGDSFCRRCEYCMPCQAGLNIPFLHLISAYYFRYNLKNWALDRLKSLNKSYQDCTDCKVCISKCPYQLNMPELFKKYYNDMPELH
jgi:predicted aldo/keto reductase-like oxidoreductase